MKCILAAGIESISGSMRGKNGTRIEFRTFTRPSSNRKPQTETRVYLLKKRERTTPLSDAEKKQRNLFTLATKYWKELPSETKHIYHDLWERSNHVYKGKRYNTLRGYFLARFIAEQKKE